MLLCIRPLAQWKKTKLFINCFCNPTSTCNTEGWRIIIFGQLVTPASLWHQPACDIGQLVTTAYAVALGFGPASRIMRLIFPKYIIYFIYDKIYNMFTLCVMYVCLYPCINCHGYLREASDKRSYPSSHRTWDLPVSRQSRHKTHYNMRPLNITETQDISTEHSQQRSGQSQCSCWTLKFIYFIVIIHKIVRYHGEKNAKSNWKYLNWSN